MAKKAKALIPFPVMKDDELLVASQTILAAMEENDRFPDPSPELEDIRQLLDDFTAKLARARKRGSPEDTAHKQESKKALAESLQKLGYYVNSVAEGNLPTVLSSGFPTNATAVPTVVPLPVRNVQLSDGRQSGHLRLDFEKQEKVLLYEYIYRRADEEEWSDRFTTTSSRGNILAPLDAGESYEVKVRAVNSKGAGDWSDIAGMIVR